MYNLKTSSLKSELKKCKKDSKQRKYSVGQIYPADCEIMKNDLLRHEKELEKTTLDMIKMRSKCGQFFVNKIKHD